MSIFQCGLDFITLSTRNTWTKTIQYY